MERISTQNSPRVDDERKHETEALVRSGAESRADEFREQEGPGDYEPDPGVAHAEGVPWEWLGPDPVSARRELSRHLGSHLFPADRDALVADAEQRSAPAQVIDALRALSPGRPFENVYDVWQALGGPVEELEERPRRDESG